MAITAINVYDRPTYQTDKVKGWDVVRVFKGSSLVSNSNSTDMIFEASEGEYFIQQFLNAGSNYKGTNRFDLSKLENFDSFRISANGLLNSEAGGGTPKLNIGFSILDNTYSLFEELKFNYDEAVTSTGFNIWFDWYLDIEITFFKDENDNSYNFIVNGNFSFSGTDSSTSERKEVSLVPFCGEILNYTTTNDIFMDLRINKMNFTNPLYIKQINIDFVE